MSDAELSKQVLPHWAQDVRRLLPIRSQFIMSGNIRDVFLMPTKDGQEILTPLVSAIWSVLEERGYEFVLLYDRVDGIRVLPASKDVAERATEALGLKLLDGTMAASLETLFGIARRLAGLKRIRGALVVDFASRLTTAPQAPDAAEHKFFLSMEKLSFEASPTLGGAQSGHQSVAQFNPIFWLLNRPNDIPSWFAIDSERIYSMAVPSPDYESRLRAGRALAPLFANFKAAGQEEKRAFEVAFADGTDGMSLQALSDIAQLARAQSMAMRDVEDAVRCFKVGALENPWRKDYLREKIKGAGEQLELRVKGQHQAVVKTVDILMRSVVGLTGAQAKSRGGRPRGVLFFAGPTGVGKTEIAKSLTQILFGDEQAYIRFDMSEFADEHTSARLLGAPPGYVGYEAGGELTNAVRRRPFSVILFDEIEKCHPRLLDKFLQILEDGRLTDGRGNTVYFSEAVLIFTSNLGIYVENEEGERVQNVKPGDGYEAIEVKVKEGITNYFKFRLGRPELLNRIGDNVVVFNFIEKDVAREIVNGMLENVASRVQAEHKVKLVLHSAVREKLIDWATADLSNGGRGIGNSIEAVLINPLARALFALGEIPPGGEITVRDIERKEQVFSVSLG